MISCRRCFETFAANAWLQTLGCKRYKVLLCCLGSAANAYRFCYAAWAGLQTLIGFAMLLGLGCKRYKVLLCCLGLAANAYRFGIKKGCRVEGQPLVRNRSIRIYQYSYSLISACKRYCAGSKTYCMLDCNAIGFGLPISVLLIAYPSSGYLPFYCKGSGCGSCPVGFSLLPVVNWHTTEATPPATDM